MAISPEQANHLRTLINERTQKDGEGAETALQQIADRIAGIQEKLNKLTQAELIKDVRVLEAEGIGEGLPKI